MEECFRDIHNIGTGCEGAKAYCRAKFNTPHISCITQVRPIKNTGPCFFTFSETVQTITATNFTQKHQNVNTTKETTTPTNFTVTKVTTICFQQ